MRSTATSWVGTRRCSAAAPQPGHGIGETLHVETPAQIGDRGCVTGLQCSQQHLQAGNVVRRQRQQPVTRAAESRMSGIGRGGQRGGVDRALRVPCRSRTSR